MHIHILGICGTFMGSLAQLAKAAGHDVSGSDANVYPPMSTQLEQAGITLTEGFDPTQLEPAPDMVVIGNAMSRGNPCVEYVLNKGLPYTSGPQWLGDNLLRDKWVLAVSGTHGKTTTSAMLAWILDFAGMAPGYLIGGVPGNFPTSARLGETPFFVVEADEYDTAFFDKRSKFLHYHSRTLVMNNLEFDHGDIFADLAAIQTQFHHLVRTVPQEGLVIYPAADRNLQQVIERGCWTPTEVLNTGRAPTETEQEGWQAELEAPDGSQFKVTFNGELCGHVSWSTVGQHNVDNALAAIAAARNVGVRPAMACQALCRFMGVKRRLELLYSDNGISVYDDFAHHPTAMATSLAAVRETVAGDHLVAVLEPRSNTMKMGVHQQQLAAATAAADQVLWFRPEGLEWSLEDLADHSPVPAQVVNTIDSLIEATLAAATPAPGSASHVVIMSNGGFAGFHGKLVDALRARGTEHARL